MTTLVLHMAKRGRKPTGNPTPTTQIRAKPETAELVALIARARGVTAADLLERLFRPVLLEQYAELYPLIVSQHADDHAGGNPTPPLPNPLVPHPKTGELVPVGDLHPPKR